MSEIDREEKDVLTAYERDEWRPVAERDAEIERYRGYARATFEKDRRVNIHISGNDLEAIQRRAIEEGIPCEALMSSVLHKYVSGQLVESPRLSDNPGPIPHRERAQPRERFTN